MLESRLSSAWAGFRRAILANLVNAVAAFLLGVFLALLIGGQSFENIIARESEPIFAQRSVVATRLVSIRESKPANETSWEGGFSRFDDPPFEVRAIRNLRPLYGVDGLRVGQGWVLGDLQIMYRTKFDEYFTILHARDEKLTNRVEAKNSETGCKFEINWTVAPASLEPMPDNVRAESKEFLLILSIKSDRLVAEQPCLLE